MLKGFCAKEFRPESWAKASLSASSARTLALYREARGRGLEAKRPFVGNSLWVTELADPDD
jgi:hypothetical protein